MTEVNDRAYDTDLLGTSSKRVVVGDGVMGTQLQAAEAVATKYGRLQSG